MKKYSILALFLGTLLMATTSAQTQNDAKSVLRLSREKCQSIQQGHYVMERKMKYMSDKDTDMVRFTIRAVRLQ